MRLSLREPALRFLLIVAAAAGVTCLSSLLAPRIPVLPELGFALAYSAVALEILLFGAYVPAFAPRRAALALVCAALLFALLYAWKAPAIATAAAVLVVAIAISAAPIGALLGARIEQPGQLAAVALVSAIADLWSVFDPAAPSARFAASALAEPERLALFALPFPLLGTPLIAPVIGAGDVVFTALYFSAFRRHELNRRGLGLGLALAYGVALIGLLAFLRPLPLLPLLGGAALLADRRTRSLTNREWRTVGIVCGVLFAAVALLRTR